MEWETWFFMFDSKTVHNKIESMVQAPLLLTAFSSKSSEQPLRMVWPLPFYRWEKWGSEREAGHWWSQKLLRIWHVEHKSLSLMSRGWILAGPIPGLLFLFLTTKSCLTLWDPMNYSTQGFPVFHISWSLFKLISIESVMPPNHLILCSYLFLLPSILSGIRVFSNESVIHIRWPKC